MNKKTLSTILVAALIASTLTGCGENSSSAPIISQPTSSSSSVTSTDSGTSNSEASTTESSSSEATSTPEASSSIPDAGSLEYPDIPAGIEKTAESMVFWLHDEDFVQKTVYKVADGKITEAVAVIIPTSTSFDIDKATAGIDTPVTKGDDGNYYMLGTEMVGSDIQATFAQAAMLLGLMASTSDKVICEAALADFGSDTPAFDSLPVGWKTWDANTISYAEFEALFEEGASADDTGSETAGGDAGSADIETGSGLKLDEGFVMRSVGDTYTVHIKALPEGATREDVTFISSDKTVATVDSDGVVTMLKPGSVMITAICGSSSASFSIEVV